MRGGCKNILVITARKGIKGTNTMRWLILPDIHDKIRRANEVIER